MHPYSLRTEYLVNPIGLDVVQPRLFWKLRSDRDGARQTAYRILVSSQPGGEPDLWDSGRVESDETIHIPYEGKPLPPMTRAFWRVETTDETGATATSDQAFWETGNRDWSASRWIGGDVAGGKNATAPAPFLRRDFALSAKPVWARLYVTALGLYEAHLNGQRVGCDVFTPGWTDYRHRVRYQAYDVTDLVQKGVNAIGAILGDGWYCGHVGMDGREIYGERPHLLAKLVIRYADGREEVISSDGDWRFAYGPIVESDLLAGETYDARREFPGWDRAGFDTTDWRPVVLFPDPGIAIDDTRHETVQVTQEVVPVDEPREIGGWPGSRFIYNLGQNIVGRVRLKLNGKRGDTIRLKYAERLTPDGNLYTAALRTARATDYFTFGEDGEAVYEPTFTFHGFQYVEIFGASERPTKDSITGIVLGSNTTPTGTFECSDPLVNQLQSNIQWGQRGNFLEVPTDCPQRDERLGWTGDAQVFIRTATHNMDVAAFFTKWAQDTTDSQGPRGEIPPVVPNPASFGGDGGPAWADAAVICPWTIYRVYGDTRLLEENYGTMKRFVDFLRDTAVDGIRVPDDYAGFRGFGDWLSTRAETPNDVIGTAYLAYVAGLLSETARVLGNPGDADYYAGLRQTARQAFQDRYVSRKGLVAGHTQTAYVLALQFGLLDDDQRKEATQMLANDVGRRGWHLSTGFVGTPYIQHVLTRNGRADVAYRLLFQKTWPSWLYPVTQGATTIWERWDGWTEDKGFQTTDMNSFNHYAYGAVGEWLYTTVAGLDLDPDVPAYKRLMFKPTPGDGLTSAKATLDTIRGFASASWSIVDGEFRYEVLVPPGCSGQVILPERLADAGPHEVGPGRHRFVRPWVEPGAATVSLNVGASAGG